MFAERACHVVATCEFQIDCCAAQFGSTSLHGSNQRASYTVATLISGNFGAAPGQLPKTAVPIHYALDITPDLDKLTFSVRSQSTLR
jgi:hypothetical protein